MRKPGAAKITVERASTPRGADVVHQASPHALRYTVRWDLITDTACEALTVAANQARKRDRDVINRAWARRLRMLVVVWMAVTVVSTMTGIAFGEPKRPLPGMPGPTVMASLAPGEKVVDMLLEAAKEATENVRGDAGEPPESPVPAPAAGSVDAATDTSPSEPPDAVASPRDPKYQTNAHTDSDAAKWCPTEPATEPDPKPDPEPEPEPKQQPASEAPSEETGEPAKDDESNNSERTRWSSAVPDRDYNPFAERSIDPVPPAVDNLRTGAGPDSSLSRLRKDALGQVAHLDDYVSGASPY